MLASALIAALALTSLSTSATASNATVTATSACHYATNTDREANDLTNVRGELGSCYNKCAETDGCVTFSWSDYNGGTCWLKSADARLVDKAGVTAYTCVVDRSTPVPPPVDGCSYVANTDRPGFDLANSRGPLSSCYDTCAKTDNCVTFSWSNYNGGTCWLKSYGARPIAKDGVTAFSCLLKKPSNVCSQYKDIDFVGMDIGNRPGTAGSCCEQCAAFPGCTAYAWNDFNGGTCWFKKSVGQTEYKPGVISSSLLPLYGGVCAAEYNVDFVGNDIGNKPSKDAGVCCGQCKATTGCKAYTWSNHNGGTCWMKSGKGATAAKAGVTSAVVAIY